MSGKEVVWRDLSSNKLHRRYLRNGQLMAYEADNADEAGEGVVVGDDVLERAEPEELCRRCFPEHQDQQAG